jgi:hypothetical protein
MAKLRKTAHAELDELRQRAADERMKRRDLEAALVSAKVKVEEASVAITDGYAADDRRAVGRARKAEEEAVAEVRELQHRVDGTALRVERAQAQHDEFLRGRVSDLLEEREQPARIAAVELTASVRETLRLSRAYLAERRAQDQLVAATPGASPRTDGPAAAHPWEAQLQALARAVSEVPEIPAPLPRWAGLEQRARQDGVNGRAKLRRKKKLTPEEERELARINSELGASPPVVEGQP